MPKGDNPNSRKNLKRPTSEEAREIGRKGGLASAKARSVHRTFREIDLEETTDDEVLTMLDAVKKLAKKGNLNAVKLYCEITGMDTTGNDSDQYEDDGLLDALKNSEHRLVDDLDMIEGDDP